MREFLLIFCNLVFITHILIAQPVGTNADTTVRELNNSLIDKVLSPIKIERGRFTSTFFPVLSFDPASGFEYGVMPVLTLSPRPDSLIKKYYRSSSLIGSLTYSSRHWINLRGDANIFSSSGFNYNFVIQYLDAPNKFYGVGNDTINTKPSRFYDKEWQLHLVASKNIGYNHYLGLMCDYTEVSINDVRGNCLVDSIPGYDGGMSLGFGPVYMYDSRDNVNYPEGGSFFEISLLFHFPRGINTYSFTTYNVDMRKYFTIFYNYQIGLQAKVTANTGDVPFYQMAALGAKGNLRGISNKYKYIDKNLWLTQVELRKMILPRVGVVVYAGIGNIFETWDNDITRNCKPIYGVGGRFQIVKNDKLNVRADYAFGPHGDSGFYATVRESF